MTPTPTQRKEEFLKARPCKTGTVSILKNACADSAFFFVFEDALNKIPLPTIQAALAI
jgi:hypothetical protein